MTLNQLEYLIALNRHRHFGRAAEAWEFPNLLSV